MSKAVRIHQHGGPEVLSVDNVEVDEPRPGQVRMRHTAIGVNYIDIYLRDGLYPAGDLPATLGMEAAGVIEALGEGVDGWAVGDRVAYPMAQGA